MISNRTTAIFAWMFNISGIHQCIWSSGDKTYAVMLLACGAFFTFLDKIDLDKKTIDIDFFKGKLKIQNADRPKKLKSKPKKSYSAEPIFASGSYSRGIENTHNIYSEESPLVKENKDVNIKIGDVRTVTILGHVGQGKTTVTSILKKHVISNNTFRKINDLDKSVIDGSVRLYGSLDNYLLLNDELFQSTHDLKFFNTSQNILLEKDLSKQQVDRDIYRKQLIGLNDLSLIKEKNKFCFIVNNSQFIQVIKLNASDYSACHDALALNNGLFYICWWSKNSLPVEKDAKAFNGEDMFAGVSSLYNNDYSGKIDFPRKDQEKPAHISLKQNCEKVFAQKNDDKDTVATLENYDHFFNADFLDPNLRIN